MTRSVTFGGATVFKPGGLTRINANALTPIGLSATGIVHILGEAEGGEPGVLHIIDDPVLAKSIFRSGPLADAIRVAFNPSGDTRIPGGAFRVVAYKTNASLPAGVSLPGDEAGVTDTSTGASTTTVITLTTGGLVVDAHIGRWVLINGEKRRIVSNTATEITLATALSAAPENTDDVLILDNQLALTARDYGNHTSQISVELEPGTGEGVVVTLVFEDVEERSDEVAGSAMLSLKYVGGPIFNLTGLVTTIDNTGLIVTTDLTAGGVDDAAGMVMVFADGSQREIATNTTGANAVYTLAAGMELTTAQQTDLAGTAVFIRNVTSADASITGANGEATNLTTEVLPTADDLAIDFSTLGITTLRQLVDYINGNTNYEASVPAGVNPDTTLLANYDFGTRNTAVDVRFDEEIDPDNKGTFRQDLQAVVDWINTYSTLVTATKATVGADEGSELPAVTGGVSGTIRDVPVFFNGGARGVSSNSSFQSGFDLLIQQRGNHIVPLISQDLVNEGLGSTATFASVAAQLKEHVKKARTTDKNEMGGYIGMNGTKAQLIAQAATFNDGDVELMGQKMGFLDVNGSLKTMDEWSAAVVAAGMRSGTNEVGEPLTFKAINTTTLTQDSSWSPQSRQDINELLAAGVMFAEVTNAGIVRWVRDITTYISDDNVAFMDGNTRDAVRFIAYDLRTYLEDRFTGLKATPATVASIRESTAAKMAEYLTDNIIVTSLDPETQSKEIPGFRNLRVFIDGTVATIRVEIFPVTGIVFQLNDIYLQLPRLAA
jgi:hypothetical protein